MRKQEGFQASSTTGKDQACHLGDVISSGSEKKRTFMGCIYTFKIGQSEIQYSSYFSSYQVSIQNDQSQQSRVYLRLSNLRLGHTGFICEIIIMVKTGDQAKQNVFCFFQIQYG